MVVKTQVNLCFSSINSSFTHRLPDRLLIFVSFDIFPVSLEIYF